MPENFRLTYFEILVEWVAELFVIYFLLCKPLQKKRLFAVRLCGGILAILVVCLPLTLFYLSFGSSFWGRSLVYALLFACAVGHFVLLYDEQFLRILMFADFAYVLQNFSYKVFLTVWSTLCFSQIVPAEGVGIVWFKVIYYTQFALQTVALYHIVIKRAQSAVSDKQPAGIGILISMMIMLAMNVLCSMADVFGDRLSGGAYVFSDATIFALKQTTNAFSLVTCVCIIALLFNATKKNDLLSDVAQLNYLLVQSERQYHITKETIDTINIKCHDMRHRIATMLDGKNISPDTMADVRDVISIYDSAITTGNKILDVILTEKSLLCEHNNIVLHCMADGQSVAFLEQMDVCCLFGNLLDNAVEAVKKVGDPDKRLINFTVHSVGDGMTTIELTNYYEGELKPNGTGFATTKNDESYHGFGMKSIANIVNKYDGSMKITTDDGVFRTAIMLYHASI